jgi:uncharacterized protein YutE (UPF0331/DUF86 family)
MVDVERVARLLDRLAEDIRSLRSYRDNHSQLPSDPTLLAAVKYHFITGIEGCARIAHHLIAAEGWSIAETNAEAVRRLAVEGVVDDIVGNAVAKAVGFRNILVHEYADVDNRQVVQHLEHLGDLEEFAGQVATWIKSQ